MLERLRRSEEEEEGGRKEVMSLKEVEGLLTDLQKRK